MSDLFPELTNFGGVARLFPLPNLVLFPNLLQPLHIFEPRYRQMTADALAGDRLIAMVLLRPGWEAGYDGRPPIFPVACLGKILSEQQLPDGRYNLQLRGLSRARILDEMDAGKLYRTARVELLSDCDPPADPAEQQMRTQLLRMVPSWTAARPQAREMFGKLLKSDLSIGTISDVLTFALPVPIELKQELLETLSVEARVSRLVSFLEENPPVTAGESSDDSHHFPPEFSVN
jgi:Lon protease-like protein